MNDSQDTPAGHDQVQANQAQTLFPSLRLREVGALLRRHQPGWRALGVSRVQVFGSVARGDTHEGSDVDVLITFGHPAGLLAQVRAIWFFEGLLGRRTDVVTTAGLKAPLRPAVLEDAVDVMDTARLETGADSSPAAPKRWRWRVAELLGTLERLEQLALGLDEAAFRADQTVQDAACMNLLRLGEGTKFVPEHVQAAYPQVPWAELRGVRNLLAHDYFGLDLALIWHTLRVELPPVRAGLQAVLEGEGLEDVV